MKMRVLILAGAALMGAAALAWAETDDEVEAHKQVLDLTGAFTNDGFKLRDGHWAGQLQPKDRALIAVNLYAGTSIGFRLPPRPIRQRKSQLMFTTKAANR
jgi:hypothetical protein